MGGGSTKCHPRNSDDGADIEVLSVSAVFRVYPSVLALLGRSSWLKNWACDRHDVFRGATIGVRCSMVLWSVGVGAAGAPVATRLGSRFIVSVVVVDKAQAADGLPRGRWPSVKIPCQFGSTSQIKFNPINFFLQNKCFWAPFGLIRASLGPK